eukprot:484995_1
MSDEKTQCVILKTKQFPDKFKNTHKPVPVYQNQNYSQEKILKGEKDRRKVYDTNEITIHSRIGQLCMKFKGMKSAYVGTAAVFYNNRKTKRIYAVTCAHNLAHYDPIKQKMCSLEYVWFDRRITTNWSMYARSKSVKTYAIDMKWVHPLYDPKEHISPNDLGIVSFIDDDRYFTNHLYKMREQTKCADAGAGMGARAGFPVGFFGGLAAGAAVGIGAAVLPLLIIGAAGGVLTGYKVGGAIGSGISDGVLYVLGRNNRIELVGYPGEKNGQLWGEKVYRRTGALDQIFTEFKHGKMMHYKIHTTGGQSGSAILFRSKIIGIHTGGNESTYNWGVKITKNKWEWIKKSVESVESNQNIMYMFKN